MFNKCMLYNVKKLEKALSNIAEEQFANIGLHPTYGYILTVIAKSDYVKTKHISYELGLNSSTVTRMVTKLEKDGLVTKGSEYSPVDIGLTDAGKALLPDIQKAWDQFDLACTELLGQPLKAELHAKMSEANETLYPGCK